MEQLVAGIDVAPQADSEVRQVVVTGGDAEKVLARAMELYALTTRGKADPVSATLDKETRTLTVVGSRAALGEFTELVKSVESTGGGDAGDPVLPVGPAPSPVSRRRSCCAWRARCWSRRTAQCTPPRWSSRWMK